MKREVVSRHRRVLSLVRAAARLADPSHERGKAVRAELVRTLGASPENVELCLRHHLEHTASPREISLLVASAGTAPKVHVLLSANVFVGALRALALAVAAAPVVVARASRREPSFLKALVDALDDREVAESIQLAEDLRPQAGEEIHLYGSDETLRTVCTGLDPSVRVRAHGAGIGIVLVGQLSDISETASRMVADIVPFDQRGCLSPRIALVHGDRNRGVALATGVASELARWEARVPIGRLDPEELAEQTRYRDIAAMLGDVLPAGRGVVGVATQMRSALIPPVGRNLHVVALQDIQEACRAAESLSRYVAAVGLAGAQEDDWVGTVVSCLPAARRSQVGAMQRPAFDGPVDLRLPGPLTPAQVLARLSVGD